MNFPSHNIVLSVLLGNNLNVPYFTAVLCTCWNLFSLIMFCHVWMVFPMIIFNGVNKSEYLYFFSSIFTCFQLYFALLDYDIWQNIFREIFLFYLYQNYFLLCVWVCRVVIKCHNVALFLKLVSQSLLCGWILSTDMFTCSTNKNKAYSAVRSVMAYSP